MILHLKPLMTAAALFSSANMGANTAMTVMKTWDAASPASRTEETWINDVVSCVSGTYEPKPYDVYDLGRNITAKICTATQSKSRNFTVTSG